MAFVPTDIDDYMSRHTSPESGEIAELVRASEEDLEHTDMLCGNRTARLLRLLIRLGDCRHVLEVGTFTGYATLQMAEALPNDGLVITLEMNERYRHISGPFFSRPAYRDKIRQIMGPALTSIENLNGLFDLIFLDADKANYPFYYRVLKPKLRRGGVMVIDNALWGGKVMRPGTPKAEAVDELNRTVQKDPEVENLMLPVRDGLMLLSKY